MGLPLALEKEHHTLEERVCESSSFLPPFFPSTSELFTSPLKCIFYFYSNNKRRLNQGANRGKVLRASNTCEINHNSQSLLMLS